MKILGISAFFHDSSAAIIIDGRIVAGGAEERFSRIKHDKGFPKLSIEYCLDQAGIAINELDVIVFHEKPIVKFERLLSQHLEEFPRSRQIFTDTMGSWIQAKLNVKKVLQEEMNYHGKVMYVKHHLSHAASAFYLSNFRKAAIVTIDGVGEWDTTTMGVGQGKEIRMEQSIRFPHSLGLLYSTITAYLGFKVNNDEYKVMGLAAYGDPKPYQDQMDELIQIYPDGSYQLNMKYFDFTWSDHMFSQELIALMGKPSRKPESKVGKHHQNVAAALQTKTQAVVLNLLNAAYDKYSTPNLCMSGGVALNSVINGKILSQTKFKKLYITPDPGDGGSALGAALYVANKLEPKVKTKNFYPLLGPSYGYHQNQAALDESGLRYQFFPDKSKLLDKVSDLLVKKKVIGWFQGRMEWGPRALGNRSILASAGEEKMRDIINAKVKKREMFRPFAPVILDKYVHQYFESDKDLPEIAKYMLLVYPFKPKGKKNVPAVVHVDGSGRLQSISRLDNPLYYDLIDTFRKKTGVPVIINTSFNIRGEPIVCFPQDAIDCFLGTDIDCLVLGDYLVTSKKIKKK